MSAREREDDFHWRLVEKHRMDRPLARYRIRVHVPVGPDPAVMSFLVAKIEWRPMRTYPSGAMYFDESGHGVDLPLAEWFMSGSLRFDGCMNLRFNQTPTMLHFCGLDQAEDIGRIFRWLYERADQLMPAFM